MLRELIVKGGPVMYPLLLCSVTALAVIVERAIFFARLRRTENNLTERLAVTRKLLAAGEAEKAADILKAGGDGPVARVVLSGLVHGQTEVARREMLLTADRERRRLYAGLRIMDTIYTIAPLLGLLGTITGILRTFRILGAGVEVVTMRAVGSGIAEALITTASGLIIAIPTVVFMNYYLHRADAMNEIIDAITDEATGLPIGRGDGREQAMEA